MNSLKIGLCSGLFLIGNGYAASNVPPFECGLSDKTPKKHIIEQKNNFTAKTRVIYFICQSAGVKAGERYQAVWTAVDTHGLAPANFKIDERSYTVEKSLQGSDVWIVQYTLSKPTKGWPQGAYHVQLQAPDNSVIAQQDFVIE